jgi:hypothetical protein
MARTAAILKALARALRRDQGSILSVIGNNFFLVSALLLQDAGAFIYLIIGLVLLFPLSTDPLRKIPASRLALWPLDKREHWLLRVSSPWVNPVTWLIAGAAVLVARGKVTVGLWGMAAAIVAAAFALSSLPIWRQAGFWVRMPDFPGPLDELIRKNVREMLATLDFYCALLLSASAVAFRVFAPKLPPEAFSAITILVVLALSSYAQCLFGLDGKGGLSRYRLMPLRGWQVLMAKDAAFLVLAIPLTLPLAPLSGLGAALVTLAVGHHSTLEHQRPQSRWRFSAGAPIMEGIMLSALMAMPGMAIFNTGAWVLAPCVAAWAGSVWWYGKRWDSRED